MFYSCLDFLGMILWTLKHKSSKIYKSEKYIVIDRKEIVLENIFLKSLITTNIIEAYAMPIIFKNENLHE